MENIIRGSEFAIKLESKGLKVAYGSKNEHSLFSNLKAYYQKIKGEQIVVRRKYKVVEQ